MTGSDDAMRRPLPPPAALGHVQGSHSADLQPPLSSPSLVGTGTTTTAHSSDRLTPESDEEGDSATHDDTHNADRAALLGGKTTAAGRGRGRYRGRHVEGVESYELEDRRRPKRRGVDGEGSSDDEEEAVASSDWERGFSPGVAAAAGGSWGQRRRRRVARADSAARFQLYTPDEERAVVRKLDRRLVVFMALLYMLSFVDRSNIGNARIAGMEEDLRPPSRPRDDEGWYEWSLTAFYITYIGFEWMALLWRLIPAHAYVAAIVLGWGLTASLQAVAVHWPMLIALRALLGIAEAAFTGVPFYLSFFFRRHELAFRTAIFISAAPLASSFASSLAWLIVKLGQHSPIAPWRLLFLVEGFPSVLAAAAAWHLVPDSPQTAHFLTPREKKIARLRLRAERRASTDPASSSSTSSSSRGGAAAVLLDPSAWLTASIFFLANMAYSSLPVFLPTILAAAVHDRVLAQALAAPPYLVAFAAVLLVARASDRRRARAVPVALLALLSALGYGVLALPSSSTTTSSSSSSAAGTASLVVRYLAVFPAAAGFFGVVVLTVAWAVNNQRTEARRGAGFALLQAVGQCGPLVGTRLYPDADAPLYRRGMAVCAGAMLGVAALAVALRAYLARLNRRLGVEEEEEEGEEREDVASAYRRGAKQARFRYML